MDQKDQIIVRFPPSPTGLLHVGSVRAALYNYLFARQNGGKFILRIEDTDKERSKKEYEENIFDSLKWLGLDYDNGSKDGVWRQSERTEIYKEKIQELIEKGAAYISHETDGENKEVVRFKNPGGKIKFQDLIRGEVEMDVGELKDFIIAKNIESPIYHLTVVVDDLESGVTHVIRGEDHISNTPRQILILEALGGKRPIYAHLPLVLAPDKSKLSKRKHGESVSLNFYREKGYLPHVIRNFMTLIGWNPGTEQELFSLNDLIKLFDLSKVQKSGAIFNVDKLDWMNKQYLKIMPESERNDNILKYIIEKTALPKKIKGNVKMLDKLYDIIFDRISKWSDIDELVRAGELDYFFEKPPLDIKKIPWKNQSSKDAKENLEKILEIFPSPLQGEGQGEVEKRIKELAEEVGKGDVLWPLRYSLSGREKSPDPFTLIKILGTEESKERIQKAIEILNNE